MLESYKYKRVVLPKGAQQKFLQEVEAILGIQQMSRVCRCSMRTIRDWRRERFRMSADALHHLATHAKLPIPQHRVEYQYAHSSDAGRKGYRAVLAKHGYIPNNHEEARKKAWRTWWEITGSRRENSILSPKAILRPEKSPELAEFIGILLGDGGLSEYQVSVFLHSVTDAEYSNFVIKKFEALFGVTPGIYDHKTQLVRSIVVSRVALVDYLHTLGLPVGNKIKQHLDIPDWIKRNKEFLIPCIRGLIDTDGSVFTHQYKSGSSLYSYKKLSFTSSSSSLLFSVYDALKAFGMNPRIGSNHDVRLDSKDDMERYFRLIGSSNPKHLRRYSF